MSTDCPQRELRSGEPVIPARAHQPDLLNQMVSELEPAPGTLIPEQGLRVTLAAAPGAGKTWISREAARVLVPRGRVLILLPTVDLLIQTAESWRRFGYCGTAIAVCAETGSKELQELDARCTTSAPRLAFWGDQRHGGSLVVFATYASLSPRQEDGKKVPGPLEAAMTVDQYGYRLAPFDLAVIDEAHRTSGALGKAWAAVHDNGRIRADRRLYMSATPRLWEIPAQGGAGIEDVGGQLVASMDDVEIYGRQVRFGLLEAIERGVLARFEIDVLEIRDPGAAEGLSEERARERRLAALQAAVLTHWQESRLRSVLSFHHRTRDAMGFSRSVHAVAGDLYESSPGNFPDPAKVSAEWLSGEHRADDRRRVVRQFADGVDGDGVETAMSFLSVCKVLGEGADITGRRGVDAVVFADTRGSVVDVVQNTGRALRQTPGEGKIARILVPVFLKSGESPQDMLSSSSYRPLVAILQALRAHDEQIIEKLMLRRDHSGRGKADDVLVDDPLYVRDEGPGGEQDGQDSYRAGDEVGEARPAESEGVAPSAALLRFFTPHDAVDVVRFLNTRVLQPQSEVWLTGYQLLCRWVAEQGHARVPEQQRVPLASEPDRDDDQGVSEESTYPLGQWCADQRRALRDGVLRAWRFHLLDELGLEWNVQDAQFAAKVTVYSRYYEEHGTLAAPRSAVFEGQRVGQELYDLRKPHGLGKKVERAQKRRRLLEGIDPYWNPAWPLVWQRLYAKVQRCLADGMTHEEMLPGVVVGGDDIGAWLATQYHSWPSLSREQHTRLEELGIRAPLATLDAAAPQLALGAGAPPGIVVAGASTWEKGMAALRQYKTREGHVRVPRNHQETLRVSHPEQDETSEEQVRLGIWRSNTRTRRHRLTPHQTREAQHIGLLD